MALDEQHGNHEAVAELAEIAELTEIDEIDQVARAEAIATIAHHGQLDKLGEPYIDHPARVAEGLDDLVAYCAAWLHDVIEDTDLTAKDLLEAGVLPEIVEVVTVLSRSPDVIDETYYARINANPIARAVKIADIADNTAPWRMRRLPADVQARLAVKYRKARAALGVEQTD